jgi:hypothetical protein
VQAANQPARRFLELSGEPRGRGLDEVLGGGLQRILDAVKRLADEGGDRYEEIGLARPGGARRLRVSVRTLADPSGVPLGRVVLLREISHEPLRRRFDDLLAELVAETEPLRGRLEQAVAELRKLREELGASKVGSNEMAALAERSSRTITALENWLAVDDALAGEAYPDAQLLRDRLRVAQARWPLAGEVPERVRELERRVEAYYESGENPKQRTL